MPQQFNIIAASDHKTVLNTVTEPAVVFDAEEGVMFKVGEFDDMLTYFNKVQDRYKSTGSEAMAANIVMMGLPRDQDEINKAMFNPAYLITLHERASQGVIE